MNVHHKRYQLLSYLWRNRYYFCIPIIIMPLVGIFISQSHKSFYHAHSDILLQEITLINPTLSDISIPYKLPERFKSLKALIQTKELLTQVAINASVITKEMPQWQQFWILSLIRQSLTLSLTGNELISMSLTWDDKEEIIKIINELKQLFIKELSQPNIISSQSASDFLSVELAEHTSKITNTENQIQTLTLKQIARSSYPLNNAESISVYFQDRIRIKKRNIEKKRTAKEAILQQLSRIKPDADVLKAIITALEVERKQMSNKYKDSHSIMVELSQDIARFNAQYLQRYKTVSQPTSINEHISALWHHVDIKKNLQHKNEKTEKKSALELRLVEFEIINQEIKKLDAEYTKLQEQHAKFNSHYQLSLQPIAQLQYLNNELAREQATYIGLSERLEMAKLAKSLNQYQQENDSRIIALPLEVYKNNTLPIWGYILLGFTIAIVQGAFCGFLAYLRNDKIHAVNHISTITKINIIATLPYIPLK